MKKNSIIFFSILCVSAFLSSMVYFSYADRNEAAVPVLNTLSSEQLMGLGYTGTVTGDDYDIWENDGILPSSESVRKETASETSVSFPIDINTATAEEFMAIKGIGSVTAEKIISYRNSHGYFYSEDDLLNVDGIGSKKLSEIREYICISPEIAAMASETSAAAVESSPETITETAVIPADQAESDIVCQNENIFPIELNTASEEELMKIDGIGEVIAGAIVEYAQNTGFNDVSDLMNVPGIGEKRFESIAPYVYVEK